MQPISLNRRDIIHGLAVLLGASALPASALAAPRESAPSLPAPTFKLLTAVADTLMPRTDTPGAVDAGVPRLFDALLTNWAAPATRATLLEALACIDAAAHPRGFAALPAKERTAMLAAHDAAHFAEPGYNRLRELLLVLYYSSEPGATVELRYEHAPGAYEPSLPITPQTRAWAGAGYV